MSKAPNKRKEIMFEDGTKAVVYSSRVLYDFPRSLKFDRDLSAALSLIQVSETSELILIISRG